MSRRALIGCSSLFCVALGLSVGVLGRAKSVDSTRSIRAVVGTPPGPAPEWRLDGARTGRSATGFPAYPQLAWRTRVEGTLERGLVVDERGRIVAASSTALTQLGPEGHVQASFELGARAISTPALLSDGKRVVVTAEGQLVTATPGGRKIANHRIPGTRNPDSAVLLPWPDGCVAVAAAQRIVWFCPLSGWRAMSTTPSSVVELLARRGSVLALTLSCDVLQWNGSDPPLRLANLGGKCDSGAALIGPDLLAAVVDDRRLVEVSLASGTQRVRVPESPLLYRTAPLVTVRAETRLLSVDGLLLGHDGTGRETLRVAVDPFGTGSDGGSSVSPKTGSGLIALDAHDRVAFALRGADPGILKPDGVVSINGAGCGEPVALVPAGAGRLAGACSNGVVWLAIEGSLPDR